MPRLLLAPMEGMVDDVMRATLTRVDGYAHCVTEFARVTATVMPHRFFSRISPELLNGGRTAAGTEVRVQLLGSDPRMMALNAARLVELAPPGIDLNFGCPAPTVNRHRGGAVLLDEPETLYSITAAVRAVVPASIPLTAKMRLGVRDAGRARECTQALASAGVVEIVVHARTKLEGYRPPAHWAAIAPLAESVAIPLVANGEVWSLDDWLRCRSESGCSDVMLGRGAVADPFLARRIRAHAHDEAAVSRDQEWLELLPLLGYYWKNVSLKLPARHVPGRLKQWLNLLERSFPQAAELRARIRALRCASEVEAVLAGYPGLLD